METGLDQLINKLNLFIKKYYLSRVLKGILLTAALWGTLFLCFAILEHFARLSINGRTILFFTGIVLSLLIFGIYIFIPLLKYFRLGKTLNHKEAAEIIGNHFSDIQDKLRNVLDLKDQISEGDQSILLASINQKIEDVNPVDFRRAVDFKQNLKYAKFVLIPLAIFLVILISGNVSLVTESSKRIVKYSEEFVPEAPFKFVVENDSLSSLSSHAFTLKMHLEGEDLPNEAEILLSEHWFSLQELNDNTFKYDFVNLQEDLTFKFKAGGFISKSYTIDVFPFPEIKTFETVLDYPAYTKLGDVVLENQGDLSVPEGTKIRWNIFARNGDEFHFEFADTLVDLLPEKGKFTYLKSLFKSQSYTMFASNDKVKNGSKIEYGIDVEKDEFPTIKILQENNETDKSSLYFKGSIGDDYGFSRLNFVLQTPDTIVKQKLDLKGDWKIQEFVHFFNLQTINKKAGDEITYYFEVFDNDGIHGKKRTQSEKFSVEIPTKEELKAQTEESNESIKKELEKKLSQSKEIQKDLKKLQEELIQKKDLSWEDKEKIKELLEKQKGFEKSIDDLKKKNDKVIQDQKEFTKDEKLIDKQEKINELLEELMDEETRKIFEEIEKMMDKLDKKDIQKKLEDLKMNNENLERELDRNLEMLKQFQVEQKFQDNIDKLNELKEKQDELAKETEKTSKRDKEKQAELKKEQDELNKEFDQFKKDQKEVEEMNKDLDRPFQLESTEKKEEEIQKEMKNSSEKMESGEKKKANDSQKKSSEKMEELSQAMQNQQQSMDEENNAEDMETLRQILENLVDLSFEEEALIEKLSSIKGNDPSYLDVMKNQNDIRFKSNLIADSLFALSKRQIAIEATVIKEVNAMQKGLDKSLEEMAERKVPKAYKNGQTAMTSANNLALLLSQVLDQMQKQQASGMKGSGSCNKPGGAGEPGESAGDKPSMQKMKSLQQQMKEQLKSLQQDLLNEGKKGGGKKPGKQPGDKPGESGEGGPEGKDGNKGKGGEGKGSGGTKGGKGNSGLPGEGGEPSSNPMSERIVKTAAKQEAIRRKLEEVAKSMEDGEGDGNKQLKKAIEKMKEIERDIINKNISTETLKRQEEIMQKMLQAEKAEREQDKDKKRKATEAKQFQQNNSEVYKKYLEEKKKQTEILYQKPLDFTPFYQKEVEKYLQKTK